jgi:hypothetical protein
VLTHGSRGKVYETTDWTPEPGLRPEPKERQKIKGQKIVD